MFVDLFGSWQRQYSIHIPDDQQQYRLDIFSDNARFIQRHNRRAGRNFSLALNAFAHLTHEEFVACRLGWKALLKRTKSSPDARSAEPFLHEGVNPPPSKDWRAEGAVTYVKNQGPCGSCWAFSTTGSIEGVNAIVTGDLVALSEQELVDCDRRRDGGCAGGLMDFAFEFVLANGGITTEDDYPYRAADGQCDEDKKANHVVTIDSYQDVPSNNEHDLLRAVAAQPVSVAIEADQKEFQFYSSGVFDASCGTDLDHGVLVVGYGTTEAGVDYWIVKNSWGPGWGERGYIRLLRNGGAREGQCGVAMQASFPIKRGPNPPPSPPKPPAPPLRPVVCDRRHSCPHDTTCCCSVPLGRLCLSWGCCPMPSATCCEDHHHCCPKNFPVCRLDIGMCTKTSVPGGSPFGSPLLDQSPATWHALGLELPPDDVVGGGGGGVFHDGGNLAAL